jgi:allantoin racemase
MSTRIFVQGIYTEAHPSQGVEGYRVINDAMQRVYETVLRPDTKVDMHFVSRSTFMTNHAYLEMLNNLEIVRGVVQAEHEGYDVAFVRCGNDPAILEARESVRIPVVAMTEAAMHLACRLGQRFAVIGVDAKSTALVERNIARYGLGSRAISHRPARTPVGPAWDQALRSSPQWFSSPDFVHERVVPEFEKVARQCIDDGAEVIVTGCALYASFTLAGYRMVSGTDVPVVESTAVGIKSAEMAGDLYRTIGLTHSKQLTYRDEVPAALKESVDAQWFGHLR